MKTKKLGSAARFGVRYGFKLRRKITNIEKIQKKRHICPKCGKESVKRKGFAVWECKTCGYKFVGGAYSPNTSVGSKIIKNIGKL